MKIEERNEKYFTKKGLTTIENRLKSWIEAFNKNEFPYEGEMLGFEDFKIDTQKECFIRLFELSSLIGFKFEVKTEFIKNSEGKETIKKVIKYG